MNIGPTEIIVVLVIALLVFGPGKLPQMGRSLGHGLREFKHAAESAKEQLGLSEVIDDVTQVKDDVLKASGIDDIKESIAGVTSTIDDAKASVGMGEITAGVTSVKSVMSFDPKKAVKGLVTPASPTGPARDGSGQAASVHEDETPGVDGTPSAAIADVEAYIGVFPTAAAEA